MEPLWQDLRYAARTLLKRPHFTLLVIVMLALGIGANTAIFSVTNAVILKPLPFKDPDRLVHLWENTERGVRYRRGQDSRFIYARPGSLNDWRERSRSYVSMSGYRWATMMMTGAERAEMVRANRVADHFFETLGVGAQLGRAFIAQDYELSAPPVVVLSDALWRSRYAADPGVVGRTISLDNAAYTVVGVMPPGFYPTRFDSPQLWTPYAFTAEDKNNRVAWGWTVFARLKPGVSLYQAHSEMDLIAAQIEQAYPEHYQNMGVVLVPADAEIIGSMGRLFFLLLCAVGLVLLVACVNVANLLLARATEREREFAVRAALGAGRIRIVRQLMNESLLLASAGGALGLLLASLGVRFLLATLPAAANIPRLDEVRLDWLAFAFTAAVSVVTGVLFGLIPALRAARPDLNEGLKENGRGNAMSTRRKRLGNFLVAGEVALSLVLSVGAGLLVQSFIRLQSIDPGFVTSRLLTLEISAPDYRYGKYETGGKNTLRASLYEQLEQRLSGLPGVESAAVASKLPVKHGPNPWGISIEGRPPPPGGQGDGVARSNKTGLFNHGSVAINRVTPGYARTLGLHLLRGRLLDERDTVDAPMVALISDTTARKYWPNEDPIGQRFTVDYTSWFPKMTVVGVVADIKTDRLDRPQYPEIYWPMAQAPSATGRILIRTKALLLLALLPALKQDHQPAPVCRVETKYDRSADTTTMQCNLVELGKGAPRLIVQANVSFHGKESNGTAKFWLGLLSYKGSAMRSTQPSFQDVITVSLMMDSMLLEVPIKDYRNEFYELNHLLEESARAEISREDLSKLLDARSVAGKWGDVEFKLSGDVLASLKDFISRQVFTANGR